MKIVKHGEVIIREGRIVVQGWLMGPEPTDNPNVDVEDLVLETAVKWALSRLTDEVTKAKTEAITRYVKEEISKSAISGQTESPSL